MPRLVKKLSKSAPISNQATKMGTVFKGFDGAFETKLTKSEGFLVGSLLEGGEGDFKELKRPGKLRGFEAKKSLGQNFLADKNMQLKLSKAMIKLANQYPERAVLELGAGQGDLTQHFLSLLNVENIELNSKLNPNLPNSLPNHLPLERLLTAIEIDNQAVDFLSKKFVHHIATKKLDLIEADMLELLNLQILALWAKIKAKIKSKIKTKIGDIVETKNTSTNTIWLENAIGKHLSPNSEKKLNSNLQSKLQFKKTEALGTEITDHSSPNLSSKLTPRLPLKYSLLSNLPYHIGSRVLVDIAVIDPQTPLAVVMQKEVADKLVDKSEDAGFGLFCSFLGMFYDFEAVLKIPPQCFVPVPKVMSQMVAGRPKMTSENNLPRYLHTDIDRLISREILKNLLAFPKKTLANNLQVFELTPAQLDNFWQQLELILAEEKEIIDPQKTRLNAQICSAVVGILFDILTEGLDLKSS